MTCVRGVEAA